MYLWNDPTATVVRAAREANASMPSYAVDTLEENHGSLSNQRVVVMGAAYRGGVKETAFSGVFATVEALKDKNAIVYVNDPMYSNEELTNLGFVPYSFGDGIDAAIIQANHAEYKSLKASDLPGVRTVLDGRRVLDSQNFANVTVIEIGVSQSSLHIESN
jgi:UDP-N-acetyl-D-mannosaminuronate dehydrogenase